MVHLDHSKGVDPDQIGAARTLVAMALCVGVNDISPTASMFSIPIWDSFGQLSVILAVEEALGARIENATMFDRLTSVRGVAAFLAERSIQTRSSPTS